MLNESLAIPFDQQGRLEFDLLCADVRVAVELDGVKHLGDPEASRRDRRKDQLLQEHGYFVLRLPLDSDVSGPRSGSLRTPFASPARCPQGTTRADRWGVVLRCSAAARARSGLEKGEQTGVELAFVRVGETVRAPGQTFRIAFLTSVDEAQAAVRS